MPPPCELLTADEISTPPPPGQLYPLPHTHPPFLCFIIMMTIIICTSVIIIYRLREMWDRDFPMNAFLAGETREKKRWGVREW